MTVYFDLSQLVQEPRRSGIQRAERELIRHWPGPGRLAPCRFEAATGELHELPEQVLGALCGDATPGGLADDRRLLAPYLAGLGPMVPRDGARVLCAELFADPARAAYYCGLHGGAETFWLVYDFLPWLHPEWFGAGSAIGVMPYLRALLSVPNLAFISETTRADSARRILRRPCAGPVIPMGGDGLGLERQRFDPARHEFVMLGTVEPRKNAAPAMRAFQSLWAAGCPARLTLIGAVSGDAQEERALLQELRGHLRFRHLVGLPDAEVRQVLAEARAMLFPSEGEGYGIPPMEALHAGVPVIVSAGLPALAGLPELGQMRLATVSPESIAAAVRAMLNEACARRLWDEAAQLLVPTWRMFAEGIAGWVQGAISPAVAAEATA